MKKMFIIALLALGNSVFAQDYCKQIKKEVTDNNTSFTYESPYKADSLPAIRAVRAYSTNPEAEFDNFNLIMAIPCEFSDLLEKGTSGETEKEETGIVIEFDDKSKLEDEGISISHDKKGDGTANRIAYYPITPDNVKDITTKKVVKIHLGGGVITVTPEMATAIQKYVTCLRDVKKM